MEKVKKTILILILVIILIIIIVGIAALIIKGGSVKNLFSNQASGKYHLVYVQTGNGSASYYGQIIKEGENYVLLKDPGYINIQAAQKEGEQPQVSFALMKDEFFKPISEMKIYKSNIVFIQQLADDSPIVNFYKNQLSK
ncbi:MAG: hypothetical protein N2692_01535 [Patescibacteria group bacterium]|jgi:hypothetical protein|nr:hypothetical protein [Patescibacteria group bacterium]